MQIMQIVFRILCTGIVFYGTKGFEEEQGEQGGSDVPAWTYSKGHKDPTSWYQEHESCGGTRQSPISLWDSDITVNESIPEIAFERYDRIYNGLILSNNGHTVKGTMPDVDSPRIRGGALPAVYRLVQFHFHWGEVHELGSEHTFGDDHFPFEMHLVHVKEGLTLDQALQDPTGLAVLGVFYELSNEKDNTLSPITRSLEAIRFKGQNVTLFGLNLFSLLPHDTSNFFTYHGSLTTPPCSEVVTWILFTETHAISHEQLRAFRNAHVETLEAMDLSREATDIADKILFNHRPPQEIHGRSILLRRHKVGLPKRCNDHVTESAANRCKGHLSLGSFYIIAVFVLKFML